LYGKATLIDGNEDGGEDGGGDYDDDGRFHLMMRTQQRECWYRTLQVSENRKPRCLGSTSSTSIG
jgi:hypothetical protein